MSKLIIVSVRDNVAEIFNKPHTEINVASAIRSFTLSLKDEPQRGDYTMYKIGELDQNTGIITPEVTPVQLMSGFELKADLENSEPVMLQEQAS